MKEKNQANRAGSLPSVERVREELGRAKSIDDFFGKEGIFARLFARTVEEMLEGELSAQLGYERYAAEGRNSGNSRNGKRTTQLQTSAGDQTIQVPRDRNGEFQSISIPQSLHCLNRAFSKRGGSKNQRTLMIL